MATGCDLLCVSLPLATHCVSEHTLHTGLSQVISSNCGRVGVVPPRCLFTAHSARLTKRVCMVTGGWVMLLNCRHPLTLLLPRTLRPFAFFPSCACHVEQANAPVTGSEALSKTDLSLAGPLAVGVVIPHLPHTTHYHTEPRQSLWETCPLRQGLNLTCSLPLQALQCYTSLHCLEAARFPNQLPCATVPF